MPLEVANFISQLVSTNPVGASDALSTADDHLRLVKTVLKASFPNINAAVNATPTQLNYLVGVTSLIQTQLNAKLASATYTAADILTKIKTVDGAASGLDADLLDGQSSAYYLAGANMTGSVPLADAFTNTSGSAPVYACRAFIRFTNNSSGTTIYGGNIVLTRSSSGLYLATFNVDMPTTGYAVVFGAQQISGNPSIQAQIAQGTSPATNAFQIEVTNGSSRVELGGAVCVAVFA